MSLTFDQAVNSGVEGDIRDADRFEEGRRVVVDGYGGMLVHRDISMRDRVRGDVPAAPERLLRAKAQKTRTRRFHMPLRHSMLATPRRYAHCPFPYCAETARSSSIFFWNMSSSSCMSSHLLVRIRAARITVAEGDRGREKTTRLTFVVNGQASETLEDLVRPLGLVLAQQPQGALVDEEATGEEDAGGRELEGHRDPPADGQVRVDGLGNAVVDPEADDGADLVSDLEEAGQDAADRGYGELADVRGDRGRDAAASDSGKGASGILRVTGLVMSVSGFAGLREEKGCRLTDEGELIRSDSHQDGADEEDDNVGLQGPFPAQAFGDWCAVSVSVPQPSVDESVLKKQSTAPPRAPAWKADVMLLEMLFEFSALMPKSLLKLLRAMVVPMNAESYPKLPTNKTETRVNNLPLLSVVVSSFQKKGSRLTGTSRLR